MTRDEFQLWQSDPFTREYMAAIKAILDSEKEKMAAGHQLRNSAEETLRMTAESVGLCRGLSVAMDAAGLMEIDESTGG